MRRVVFNQKGGVGKSSITVNLAAVSAAAGKRTLVVDLDAQCNASQYLLGMDAYYQGEGPEPNIGTFFGQALSMRLRDPAPGDYIHDTRFDNLAVLPAHPELGEIEHLLESKHKIYKLRGLLNKLDREFDAIYVDTPPSYNFYTLSALIAADGCVIPFDCDAFSRRALYSLLENIQEVRDDHNEELRVEGIVANQYQPRARLPRELVAELRDEGLPVMDSPISSSVIMRESHEKASPLIQLAPNHKLTGEYQQLYQELGG